MKRLAVTLLLFLCACAAPVYRVEPGRLVVLQFVKDDATVKRMGLQLNPAWAKEYRWIKALYWREGRLIIISSASFSPELLAHELYRVVGRDDLAEAENNRQGRP